MSIPHSDTAYIGKFGIRIDQIIEAVRSRVPGWSREDVDSVGLPLEGGIATASSASHDHAGFSIHPLHGGMSNLMYIVTRECDNSRVVARILSPALDAAIDRVREASIVSYLSSTAIGPALYGTTRMLASSGTHLMLRVEEFVPGRTLGIHDLKSDALAPAMAVKVADLHASRPNLNAALARSLSSGSVASGPPTPLHEGDSVPEPCLQDALWGYLNLITNLNARSRVSCSPLPRPLRSLMTSVDWSSMSRWTVEVMSRRGGPVVLTHGDLQEGNWIHTPEGRLVLIDYEYSRYDYMGFDLGNLNCEHTFDYAVTTHPGFKFTQEAYPAVSWQRCFLAAYAARRGMAVVDLPTGEVDADHDVTTCRVDVLTRQFGPTLAPLAAAARVGMLASHLYWSMWSMIMAGGKAGVASDMLSQEEADAFLALRDAPRAETPVRASTPSASVASGHVVFDYAEYGLVRAREFVRLRDKYLAEHPREV